MADPVLFEVDGGIATLRLNRPGRRNAVSLEMRTLLAGHLARIGRDEDIRALILCGSGGSFCAGGDIRDMQSLGSDGEAARRRMRQTGGLAETISSLDIPVIAAVDGPAYGGGFGLALTADFVLAGRDARFCASFGKLGLVPDFGLHHSLPRRVGLARAKSLIFSQREVGAEEALGIGLADAIFEPGDLEPEARALAQGFLGTSPTALAFSKSILNQSFGFDFGQVADAETAAQALCFTTPQHAEARRRFLAPAPGHSPPA
ncbi:enoyl-CoA hydratase/isomerase family protein [Antarcticimicrobium luteum]|uniref:Enoyl-CoA hydratase/isomerase family protein n=1 Tax=Antarcticimicrobium luteum TaxID=2547397 RepID=A0A4R5V838_9RHOB|nr:enoyl-CoA hydratase/isomerase family protein [Antarcticimicrobium luteum]TDK48124.1 enoyl-CoA hydratase/isomerase family protein [Antarcticimicrobium luteum]